jgi:hypothetical protein
VKLCRAKRQRQVTLHVTNGGSTSKEKENSPMGELQPLLGGVTERRQVARKLLQQTGDEMEQYVRNGIWR